MGDITFNITIHFQNGITIEKNVPLPKAVKLASKENVIVTSDTDCVEVKGINNSIVIPLNMVFVVPKSLDTKHSDSVSKYMLYKRDNGRCGYCGKEISLKQGTIDHIFPKSRGGKTTWDNVVLSCYTCNNKKDNKTPREAEMKLRVTPYNPKKGHKR